MVQVSYILVEGECETVSQAVNTMSKSNLVRPECKLAERTPDAAELATAS